jgi:ABC-2 type transport system ATP-binding protein
MQTIIFDSVHKVFRRGGLFFRERTETYALRGLSLGAEPNEVLSLLGPNGSGKSTALRLVSTTLLPDAGRILVNGLDTRKQSQTVRRQVGIALASERSFFPRLTVRENLDFFAALEDMPKRECASRIESALSDVGLHTYASKQAMKLSSGMYQRLGIARALMKTPRVLLLDEPSRSLDPAAAGQLWQLVRNVAKSGMTVMLATHNFSEAVAVSDRIGVLFKGKLLGLRPAQGISEQQLRDWYLQITGEQESHAWVQEVPA